MNNAERLNNLVVIIVLYFGLVSTSVWAKDKKETKRINISGYLMLGHDSFDSSFLEDGDSSQSVSEIRRARLSFKTKLHDNWQTKLQLDFADGNTELKDAYFQYKGWQWADFTLGKQKEAFGLEKLTSSRNSMMIERSIVTEALAPGRSLGVSLSGGLSSLNWQLGYFQPDESENASAITGRLSWLPWQQENNLIHIGLAFSERDLNGSAFRINEPMEVYLSDSLIEGTKLLADKVSLQGVEFLWQKDGLTAASEWQQATVTDDIGEEFEYQGGYIQLSYLLSGENRTYKNSKMAGVSNTGWELTSRYSQFELIEEANEAQIFSVGVNLTVNENLKFMADYIKTKQFKDSNEFDTGNAISLRAQYTF
jgi:phosphate-selective porin OprO/OprP